MCTQSWRIVMVALQKISQISKNNNVEVKYANLIIIKFEALGYIQRKSLKLTRHYMMIKQFIINIKPDCILLLQGVKLSGLKLASCQNQNHLIEYQNFFQYPFQYSNMSPQILEGQQYSAKCDIWSVGMIFYELLYGLRPWCGMTKSDLLEILKPNLPNLHKTLLHQIKSKNMLKIQEVNHHSWSSRDKSIKIEVEPLIDMGNIFIPDDSRIRKFNKYTVTTKLFCQGAFANMYRGYITENQIHQAAVGMIQISVKANIIKQCSNQ